LQIISKVGAPLGIGLMILGVVLGVFIGWWTPSPIPLIAVGFVSLMTSAYTRAYLTVPKETREEYKTAKANITMRSWYGPAWKPAISWTILSVMVVVASILFGQYFFTGYSQKQQGLFIGITIAALAVIALSIHYILISRKQN